MTVSSLLGHTQELLATIRSSVKPADSVIETFFRSRKYLGSRDRRFIAETTYGTLRNLRYVEWLCREAVHHDDLLADDDYLLTIVSFLLAVNKHTAISVESIASNLKGSRIKESLPQVLEFMKSNSFTLPEDKIERIGIKFSFPDWMVRRLLNEYPEEEVERLCASLNQPAQQTIRANTLKATREECRQQLRARGIETDLTAISSLGLHFPKRMDVFSIDLFREGWFEMQDEGSQILPLLIDPKPTAKVLDACAGAGGKTLAFSGLMKNRGEIVAADISDRRLDELRKRAKRSGVQNVRVRSVVDLADLSADFSGFFDIVFVDAPCSGLGTIRRNPGMKWTVTEHTVDEVSEKQRRILESSAALVKRGGRLVYATCTFLRQENEDIVESFLRNHPEFAVAEFHVTLPGIQPSASGFVKLLPHIHGTDGFFVAQLERTAR